MIFSRPPATGCRACLQRLSTSCTRLQPDITKRSNVSGVLPAPKLDYDALIQPDQLTNAARRNASVPERSFLAIRRDLDAWRATTRNADSMRAQQSRTSEEVRKASSDEEKSAAIRKARTLRDAIQAHDRELSRLEHSLLSHGLRVPNVSHPDSPIGPESHAKTVSTHGSPPIPADPRRDHNELNEIPGLRFFDRDAGVISSGSGFAYLTGGGALLENALVGYAMEVATRKGFEPIVTPDIVRRDVADRCGFVPREGDQQSEGAADRVPEQIYGVHGHHESGDGALVLAGTAEIPLAGALQSSRASSSYCGGHNVQSHSDQPSSTDMKASDQELDNLLKLQIELYESLGLTFRVLDMPTEELGASAHRKYDIEAWMPGRGAWGEISSVSNCTDFQARRLHIRHRHLSEDSTGPLPYAHTLNGTAAATPRLIIALLENGVRFGESGVVEALVLPQVLRRHWVGGDHFGRVNIEWS
ncbi:threonyl-tRNA synthetase [Ceratobasidium sp. AG-Ba]|nr:threonyl-tRNA synthetase [Ceratobasidium sp. AG-Ba]